MLFSTTRLSTCIKVDRVIVRVENYLPTCTTTSYGFMALQRRRNNLVCHYCGRRSQLLQDGTVKQWECKNCESMNYLDENGEVADPPISETSSYEQQSSNHVQYAQAPRRPGPALRPSTPVEPLFCADCLRNQQLFTTSLAQYLPDDSDPDYEVLYKNYYKFRRNLEKRYPQICADCEPRVTARMQQAGYTAQTDCLQRMLDKSKKGRSLGPSYKFSWASLFDFLGLLLWTFGLLIQISWNVLGCFGSQTAALLASFVSQSQFLVVIPYLQFALVVPPQVLHVCSSILPYLYSANGAPDLAKSSLIMSMLSIWWNPEYKNSVRGFNEHISGYQDWYKMQVLSLAFRLSFWAIMSKSWFGDSDASVVKAAHAFMVMMTLMTSFVAYQSINVDHSRIFVQTPEKLKRYIQPKPKTSETASNTAQLFAKDRTPRHHVAQPLFPQKTTSPPAKRNVDFNNRPPKLDGFIKELNSKKNSNSSQGNSFQPSSVSRSFNASFSSSQDIAQGSPQAIKDRSQLSALENVLQPNFGPLPLRANGQSEDQSDGDMDWEPLNSSPIAIPRAFRPDPSATNRGFGGAPVAPVEERKGAFWYRVPEAPRSQNAKLRNPSTPSYAAPSERRKENFFRSMSGKKSVFDMSGNEQEKEPQNEMNMAQQKFFPSESARYAADDGLSEMMSQSFSLKEKVESEVQREEEEKGRRWWHLLVVVVVLAVFGVYFYLNTPSHEDLYEEILALSRRGGGLVGGGGGEAAAGFVDTRKWDSDYR